jgi:ribosomal protein L11 methyltransferase
MPWLRVELPVSGDCAEAFSDALIDAGALSASIEDAKGGAIDEEPIYAEPGEAKRAWNQCVVSALFDADVDAPATVCAAARALGLATTPNFSLTTIEDEDWVKATQSQFAPIEITRDLWIVPTWHAAPNPSATNIVLDPGRAFGTGSHATTKLCLRWLAEHIGGGETVLDYGCGSGILAIAALKLGAAHAIGTDIDLAALEVAKANAQANRVAPRWFAPNELPQLQADVTVANILANPLKVLAPVIANATRAGGEIVLSGILRNQAIEVMENYLPWCALSVYDDDDDWVCLAGKRQT